jgi:DNA mismatch repair protein MutS2
LLDELGTATDPAEGGALAVAILERLAERAGLTVVSTHLASLKNWAAEHPGGRNASFRLSATDRRPTFQLVLDLPGISEALVIAEQVGLPPEIIERARALRPKVEHDATALLLSLQAKEEQLQRELEQLRHEKDEIATQWTLIETTRQELERERRTMKKDLLAEAERRLREMKEQVEALIARQPSRHELTQARRSLEQEIKGVAKERAALSEAPGVSPEQLEEHQRVRLRSLQAVGEIVSIDRQRRQLVVAIGTKRWTLPFSEVEAIEAQAEPQEDVRRVVYVPTAEVDTKIDLHGKRVEEAIPLLEKFIDTAYARGVPAVTIVHGHGTGRLRRAVEKYLDEHPCVASRRPGVGGEGGGAVTIAELKK